MKKILILSLNYYPKFIGGAEVAIKEITDRIDPNEYSFDMVTLRFDSNLPIVEKIGNVTIYRIGFTRTGATIADLKKFPLVLNKFIFQFSAAKKAQELHEKKHYDAIWSMMAHSCGVPGGLFKSRNPDVKYVLTLQEGDPISYIKRKMLPLYPLFVQGFRKADAIQAISTFLAGWAKAMGFRGLLEVIPNAVNTKHFSQIFPDDELVALKQKLGKREDDVYMITTSRLVTKNAIDDCIKSLSFLPNHVRFLVLGIGPDEAALKQLAKDQGLENRVKFLGQVDHKEMPKYLKVSEIFIRPSRSEGMGNSFIEAMAAGIPIIATQEGGIADFLFDEKRNPDKPATGWAVDKDSPEQIAQAVGDILTRPDKVKQVTETAKKMVFEKYDWDLIAKDMREKVFARII